MTNASGALFYLRFLCRNDLYFLMTKVLGYGGSRVDPEFHQWFCTELMVEENTLFLMPRDHTKSTTGIEVKVVQEILSNPNNANLVASKTLDLSKDRLGVIKQHLMNPVLQLVFPDILYSDPGRVARSNETKWTAEAINVKRSVTRVDETVAVAGMGKAIAGRHYDRIFLDDIIDQNNVTSEAQMEKVMQWWRLLQPILSPRGIIRIYGTRYDEFDIYGYLIRRVEEDKKKGLKPRFRIIKREVKEDGEFIYKYYDEELLEEKRRDIGNDYVFRCNYYNDPNPLEERIFKSPFPTYKELPGKREDYEYCMTVDPSFTVSVQADFTGIAICAYNKQNQVFIEVAKRYKLTVPQLLDRMYEYAEEYPLVFIGVEAGAWQNAIKDMFDYITMTEGRESLMIQDVKLGHEKNAKHNRIMGVAGYFEKGIVRIKEGNEDLTQEMYYYSANTRQKDDVLDSVSMQPKIHIWGNPHLGNVKHFEKRSTRWRDMFKIKRDRGYGYY